MVGKGYSAEIVIVALYFNSFLYIEELAKLAAENPLTLKIHFTIDMESAIKTKKMARFLIQ